MFRIPTRPTRLAAAFTVGVILAASSAEARAGGHHRRGQLVAAESVSVVQAAPTVSAVSPVLVGVPVQARKHNLFHHKQALVGVPLQAVSVVPTHLQAVAVAPTQYQTVSAAPTYQTVSAAPFQLQSQFAAQPQLQTIAAAPAQFQVSSTGFMASAAPTNLFIMSNGVAQAPANRVAASADDSLNYDDQDVQLRSDPQYQLLAIRLGNDVSRVKALKDHLRAVVTRSVRRNGARSGINWGNLLLRAASIYLKDFLGIDLSTDSSASLVKKLIHDILVEEGLLSGGNSNNGGDAGPSVDPGNGGSSDATPSAKKRYRFEGTLTEIRNSTPDSPQTPDTIPPNNGPVSPNSKPQPDPSGGETPAPADDPQKLFPGNP